MTRPRVVIVDDEQNVRLALTAALETLDLELDTAADGEQALAAIAGRPCEAMVLDLRMPGKDGLHVLREVSRTRPEIKVIILTAHGTVESAVEAIRLGAVDFLQKPCTPAEIRDLVQRVLRRGRLSESGSVDYETLLELARRAINDGRHESAAEFLRRAIQHGPNRPEAFTLLGLLLELEGKVSEALKNYRAALTFAPGYELAADQLHRATALHRRPPSRSDIERI